MKTTHPILLISLSKSWGGLEMVAYEFADELKSRNIPFIFVCCEKSPLQEKLQQSGIFYLEKKSQLSLIQQSLFLSKIINQNHVQKIVIQKLQEIKPLLLSKYLNKNLQIFGFSHMWMTHFKKDLVHRYIYKQFSKIIALTPLQKLNLLDHIPLTESQISVVPNWVSSQRLKKVIPKTIPFKFKEKNNKPLLTGIIASRLDPQKGQDLAIEALERLQNQGVFFNLIIMGDNTINEMDFRSKLAEMISEKQLNDFVQLHPSSDSILDYISGADFLLMPSWEETFGRVLPEAMTLGVPCIASNKGGVPDLIEGGKNGLLFKSRSVDDLIKTLKSVINDPSLLQRVAIEGLKEARRFRSEDILTEILKIFKIDFSPTHKPMNKSYPDRQIEAPSPVAF